MSTLEAPHFYPTAEEFRDFSKYVAKIEPLVEPYGMCLVSPPEGWRPRANAQYNDIDDRVVKKPIRQEFTGSKGVYYAVLLESKSQPVRKFRLAAEEFDRNFGPENNVRCVESGEALDDVARERFYWRNIRFRRPVYGADVSGSLFDEDVKEWNPGKLGTILDLVGDIAGVTQPYLYFGMYGASFAWHTEDMELYSINYIHFGAPKTWYFLPRSQRLRFELLCKKLYASHFDDCREFLRHKQAMVAPEVLQRSNLTYGKAVHREGEFALVLPGVYHSGFNQGFNCAESVNFASESWLALGRAARRCECRPDTVTIDCDRLEALVKESREKERKARSAAKNATKERKQSMRRPRNAEVITNSVVSDLTTLGGNACAADSHGRGVKLSPLSLQQGSNKPISTEHLEEVTPLAKRKKRAASVPTLTAEPIS